MVEADRAREALAEVDRRRGEAARLVLRSTFPSWWVAAVLGVVVLLAVQTDLRSQIPEWNGWLTRWAVPAFGTLVMIGLGLLVIRRARICARAGVSGGPSSSLIAIAAATYIVVTLGVGMPLRYFRVPWDQTISAVSASLAILVGWAVWRIVDARREN